MDPFCRLGNWKSFKRLMIHFFFASYINLFFHHQVSSGLEYVLHFLWMLSARTRQLLMHGNNAENNNSVDNYNNSVDNYNNYNVTNRNNYKKVWKCHKVSISHIIFFGDSSIELTHFFALKIALQPQFTKEFCHCYIPCNYDPISTFK